MRRAEFFTKLEGSAVRCDLCFHSCILSEGQTGFCLGRTNVNAELIADNYGRVITIADDPIEKKPLYHFHPGSSITSIAQFGCNLRCPFCQNYDISQSKNEAAFIPIEGMYGILKEKKKTMLAFTYTEPLMWYEYLLDFSKSYFEVIDTVLVTNGTINERPLKTLLPFIKAANVDLKSFNERFYRDELKGDLSSVKRTIELFSGNKVHTEITHLLIPGKTDDKDEFKSMVKFISSVSRSIPFHISRYFPNYKYNIMPTSLESIESFYFIAKEHLEFVYTGNLSNSEHSDTLCPACKTLLIKRNGYHSKILIDKPVCPNCKRKINIIL